MGGRLGWAAGPINVAASYGRTSYGNNAATPFAGTALGGGVGNNATYNGDYDQWNIAGQYDFGIAKLMAQFGEQSVDAIPATGTPAAAAAVERTMKHFLVGGLFPVGAGEIRASYQHAKRDDGGAYGIASSLNGAKVRQWTLGYVHNLSKRTAVYTTYANQRATGTVATTMGLASRAPASAGESLKSTGIDLGLRHSF
jgi:predicted porin